MRRASTQIDHEAKEAIGRADAAAHPSWNVDGQLQLDDVSDLNAFGLSDPRLDRALAFVLSRQDRQGRWQNANAYRGRTWSEIEPGGGPSKWVTLRACGVVKAMHRSEEQCIA